MKRGPLQATRRSQVRGTKTEAFGDLEASGVRVGRVTGQSSEADADG